MRDVQVINNFQVKGHCVAETARLEWRLAAKRAPKLFKRPVDQVTRSRISPQRLSTSTARRRLATLDFDKRHSQSAAFPTTNWPVLALLNLAASPPPLPSFRHHHPIFFASPR